MKIALVFASVHHGNTRKIVNAIADNVDLELIDATIVTEKDMHEYDLIGFASGIFYSEFHHSVVNFANTNLIPYKNIFTICTYGSKKNYVDRFMKKISGKKPNLVGSYGCLGFDTFGPFKLVGGIAKGHPTNKEINEAIKFVENLLNIM